jgi:hypothetical protein
MIFIFASIAWMAEGWLETKTSLVIQNVILLLISDWSLALVSQGREGSHELTGFNRKTRHGVGTPC